ncbi:MAG: hypothetical protein A3G25_12945 [Betaproteobacteria bacterium RIFCSPLOWO2_12_FULL_63_13]|nr:MAG: hypothetical protein A3G25_12945 [Betaproteobacteria bacterium RIFCSPLOWO2_12_FULL_63_13]
MEAGGCMSRGYRGRYAARMLIDTGMEVEMNAYTPDFSLGVQGIKGHCPAGEAYAKQQSAERSIPVLSCEGPCIRGEIARLAANLVAQEVPSLARACHAETFFVPHSSMAEWVKGAAKSIMIDGCFLGCHGRVLKGLVGEEKLIHIDAHPYYRKYTDIFLMDDVPEDERKAVAREVAGKIIAKLKEEGAPRATAA